MHERSAYLMPRRTFLIGGAFLAATGCAPSVAPVTYSYRLKATVVIDGRRHSGESVIKVRYSFSDGLMNFGGRYRADVWAEAPIIDLGPKHGLLFVLLVGRYDVDTGEYAFGAVATSAMGFRGSKTLAQFRKALADDGEGAFGRHIQSLPSRRETFELSPEEFPIFARFGDLRDPKSVVEVNPVDLEEVYGPGAVLESITMQITDAPPTEQIDAVLPWLATLEDSLGGAQPFERSKRTFAQSLPPSYFRDWPS